MGMFDSLYDSKGNEWQTKAFGNSLKRYEIGDKILVPTDDCQVEVLGELNELEFINSYATIKARKLVSVHDDRDLALSLIDYHGYFWAVNEGD